MSPETIPVITLWQPYASLIFAGRKTFETRGFAYPAKYHGKRIAIHAAARFAPARLLEGALHELCMDEFGCSYDQTLPRSAILGTVRLTNWFSTDDSERRPQVGADDLAAGDWSDGRFAWELSDPTALAVPLTWKGSQGWRSMPAETIAAAIAA